MVEANRIMWVKRLFDSNDGKWKAMISDIIKPFSLKDILETNLNKDYISAIPLIFYNQIFDLWNKSKSEPETCDDYSGQPFWNNKFITIPKSPKQSRVRKFVSWVNYYNAGIKRIAYLCDSYGNFLGVHQISQKFGIKKLSRPIGSNLWMD